MNSRTGEISNEPSLGRRPRTPTITDVARAAGVAPSTVSRAFTRPDRVNDTTRQHVLAIAHELGYRGGHPAARTLLRGHSETIALLVPDITNPHFFGLIRGAERQAAAAGFTLVLADTEESPQAELRHVERLGRSVDGIVLGASRLSDDQLRTLSAAHTIALVNRHVDGLLSVNADQRQSVSQIVSHLVGLGHRRIAYLTGPRTSWVAGQRWDALVTAANRHGISVTRLGPFPPFLTGGAEAADALLATEATAAITHNGVLGIGVLRRMAERGLAVPEDVSVVACDDVFTAEFFTPALTARVGPMEGLGRAAVNHILRSFDDRPDESGNDLVLPAQLVVRGSTGPAPRESPCQHLRDLTVQESR